MAAAPFARSNIGDLSDRIALITGASSGIGRMIAQAYAAAGAYVVAADITPNPPKAPLHAEASRGRNIDHDTPTAELLNSKWPGDGKDRSKYVKCDVTKADDVSAAVKFAAEQYGRLDIMVNNAGVILESRTEKPGLLLHETDVDLFDKTMAINARGVWIGMKYAITQMLTQEPHPTGDRGWIVNMSSIFGLVGCKSLTSYCTSKGGVTNLTKAAALEYAQSKIHINSIHPGYCDSPLLERPRELYGIDAQGAWASMHPWGRICWPEDVARMAVFAAGDGVAFVTGQRKFQVEICSHEHLKLTRIQNLWLMAGTSLNDKFGMQTDATFAVGTNALQPYRSPQTHRRQSRLKQLRVGLQNESTTMRRHYMFIYTPYAHSNLLLQC